MSRETGDLSGLRVAQQQQQPAGDIWSDFRDSALHSFAQRSLDGVTQLIDSATGTHLQKEVQFFKPPQEADFGSGRWVSQQLGAGVGMLPWIWGISKMAGKAMGSPHAVPGGPGSRMFMPKWIADSQVRYGATKMFATGAVYDGVFRPVGPESHGEDWRVARGLNALSGGTTWGALSLSGSLLSAAGKSSWGNKMKLSGMDKGLLAAVSENKMAAAAITAVPAGIVSANIDAARFEGRAANIEEMSKATTQMAVVGVGLAHLPTGSHTRRGLAKTEVAEPARSPLPPLTEVRVKTAEVGPPPKGRLTPEQLKQYELSRPTDGANQRWVEIYQEAFPAGERQAESALLEHFRTGHMELHETRDPSGKPVSFIITEVFESNATRPKILLNAYTATKSEYRSTGIGTAAMHETVAQLKAKHPDAPAWFAEIESSRERGITTEQLIERQRRWDFYSRNGWKKAEGFDYVIPQYQTRTLPSGKEVTFASWRHPLQMELIYYPLNSSTMKGGTIRDAVTTIWQEGYEANTTSRAAQRSLSMLENDKNY